MKYYASTLGSHVPSAWFMPAPQNPSGEVLDPQIFTRGFRYEGEIPLSMTTPTRGVPQDVNWAGRMMPVVRREIGELLEAIAPSDIQRVPVRVGNVENTYEIPNVITRRACVNESRSRVRFWTADSYRPDLAGTYKVVDGLVIDADRTEGAHLLRIINWETQIILSQVVRDALVERGTTGIDFFEAF